MSAVPHRARRALLAALGLALAGAAAAQPAGLAPRVAEVVLALPAAPPRAAAGLPAEDDPQALVGIARGDPLSRRAARAAVQRLWQTGRYRSVRIRSEALPPPPGEAGAWVRLTVEATPVRRIARITVSAERADGLGEDALRGLFRFAEGEPFEDEDVPAAEERVREALARRGRREARATVTARGETSVALTLAVDAGPVTEVGAVAVPGNPGLAPEALAALATRPGAPLDQDQLAEDARKLRVALHEAGWRRAVVATPQVAVAGRRAEVTFPVEPGPRVTLRFAGNAAVPAPILERELGLEPDAPLDAGALDGAAERLLAAYRARGYATAQVEARELPAGGALTILFRIDEGVRYRVHALRFLGTQARSEREVRSAFLSYLREDDPPPRSPEGEAALAVAISVPGERLRPVPPPPLPAGEYVDEAAWDHAAERVVDDYRAEGWLEAVYLGSAVALDARLRTAQVTLRLREGARTRLERVELAGNAALPAAELERLVALRPGDPLRYRAVEEARQALLRRYAARGFAWARVEAAEDVDRVRHAGVVRFEIHEGPQARIARVLVTGNRRTRPEVVREALALHEGSVWDPEAAARSEAALLSLGVFRSVNLRLHEPDAPQAEKDLLVELSERPFASITQSTGFSIANGPRVQVEYVRPNLGGRAVELSLRGKVNYPLDVLGNRPDLAAKTPADRLEGRADAGLRTSRFSVLSLPAGAHADLIGEVLHRRAYNLSRGSGVTGVDVALTRRVVLSLQYELEVDRIQRTGASGPLTQADVERLRFSEGYTTLNALRPSFTLDFRDDPTHPRRGWFASGYAEYEHSLGGEGRRALAGLLPASDIQTNLVKTAGTLSGYLPVLTASTLALSVRGGRVFPLDGRSQTIVPRRFFLGGASSMRGFPEEQMIEEDVRRVLASEAEVCASSPTSAGCTDRGRRIANGSSPVSEGGEAFLLGKAELRLSFSPSIETGLFLDVGNLWLDPTRLDVRRLRANAGVGLRFVTPVGPAALDLGFNLSPDQRINEPVFAPHFTIGLF